jgi:hypothetical protein
MLCPLDQDVDHPLFASCVLQGQLSFSAMIPTFHDSDLFPGQPVQAIHQRVDGSGALRRVVRPCWVNGEDAAVSLWGSCILLNGLLEFL